MRHYAKRSRHVSCIYVAPVTTIMGAMEPPFLKPRRKTPLIGLIPVPVSPPVLYHGTKSYAVWYGSVHGRTGLKPFERKLVLNWEKLSIFFTHE